MNLTLYIIRHCQPSKMHFEYPDIKDPRLTTTGEKQATLLAERALEWKIDSIYCSSMIRSIQTAQAIHAKQSIPLHMWPDFSETNRPMWPELRKVSFKPKQKPSELTKASSASLFERMREKYSDLQFTQSTEVTNAWWVSGFKETREETYDRGRRMIQGLLDAHALDEKDSCVAVVCHNAFASVMISILTESPPCDHNRFPFHHGAVSCLEIEYSVSEEISNVDFITTVQFTNDIRHFPKELVTG